MKKIFTLIFFCAVAYADGTVTDIDGNVSEL